MDPRLFAEWAQVDEHLRGLISARDRRRRASQHGQGRPAAHHRSRTRGSGNPAGAGARETDLVFIVSREDSKTYTYLKQALACQSVDVIVDRRSGDRRQVWQPATPDRRSGERRRHDVKTDLQTYGWALAPR
jgi:hypothetical protein